MGEGGQVMRIVYHHRTRSTDAQRIHIQEMVRAFEELGHTVQLVSLVPTEAGQHDAQRDAGDAWWKSLVRKIPCGYELVQLAYNLIGIPMLLRAVYRSKPDFIYERYSLFNFTGVLVAHLCNLPIVLEVNSPFALEQARDKDIRMTKFAQWTERAICNRATRVVVVSTPLARIMERVGVDSGKLDIMPNGVNLGSFQPRGGTAELRRSLGIRDEVVIGFVGWFRKWHGLELLLEAFDAAGLRDRAKLLMVGDGQAMADLQAEVNRRSLRASVIFTGPLPHAEVPKYAGIIDVAVQPAANEYCCPMKILEYMALAKPIVAPRQENITELLREGKEAEYFTPGDAQSLATALVSVTVDRQRAMEMGRRARAAIDGRGYLWVSNAQRVVNSVSTKLPLGSKCRTGGVI
jgi:glycosyltransferase involved in cell wall biosynthesis